MAVYRNDVDLLPRSRRFWIGLLMVVSTYFFGSSVSSFKNHCADRSIGQAVRPFTTLSVAHVFLPRISSFFTGETNIAFTFLPTADLFGVGLCADLQITEGLFLGSKQKNDSTRTHQNLAALLDAKDSSAQQIWQKDASRRYGSQPLEHNLSFASDRELFALDSSLVEHPLPSCKAFVTIRGKVGGSLYKNALQKGVDPQVAQEVVRAFKYTVDLQNLNSKEGEFSFLYRVAHDRQIKTSDLLMASVAFRGKKHYLYRFSPPGASPGFYTENGSSAHKTFLVMPISGARLSSFFGYRRHPILGYVRMHKGVDFSAPVGTPVMAAGDGVIEKMTRSGSYGNYILIRHQISGYKTAYAHLSRYASGLRVGAFVKQGTVIGYVGKTGRATGAHLHFELIQNGIPINPKRLNNLPSSRLSGRDLRAFRAYITQMRRYVRDVEKSGL